MLVLSRREKQRIRLGDSIIVTVVRVTGDRVRLGIEAPADILVLRDELEPRAAARPVEASAADPEAPLTAPPLTSADLSAIVKAAEIAELSDIGELVDSKLVELEIVIARAASGAAA